MDIPTIEEENALLREFYDAWVFFHKVKREITDQPSFDCTRQEIAAQQLVDSAQAVERHIQRLKRATATATQSLRRVQ